MAGQTMSRTEFIAVTAVVLFLAIVLGWFARGFVRRFVRVEGSEIGEIDWMAKALQEAEEARDQAVRDLASREAELRGKLNEAQAETRAAMDSLRHLRRESDELRAYIEQVNQSQ